MDRLTLDEMISALVALREYPGDGDLHVTAIGVDGWTDLDHGLEVVGVEKRSWHFGGGYRSVNIKLRLEGR